ncbi:MAG: ACT domain-containing protein [Bacteroidota bacterium]
MSGEKNLELLLKTMKPKLNEGDYVFCTVTTLDSNYLKDIEMFFKEEEAITIIVKKEIADAMQLNYTLVMSWITLTVHSSIEAVGLTAAFSKALSQKQISCNVVAAFYHDHIFVAKKDAIQAMSILNAFSE